MPKPYVPDLPELASICEANYVRLLRLLPDLTLGTDRVFNLVGGPNHATKIRFSVVEDFKYTLTIAVEQTSDLHDFLNPPQMQVRLYQDVRMAEVISFDNHHRFNGIYHYPNEQMRQPDEKYQINHFLAEWLNHCLEHGEAHIELNYQPLSE